MINNLSEVFYKRKVSDFEKILKEAQEDFLGTPKKSHAARIIVEMADKISA